MRIRGWLTGLIVFLLAPSLLFASLWFYNKFDKVSAIDRSLKGLHLVQALGPLVKEKAVSGEIARFPVQLRRELIAFGGPKQAEELTSRFDVFINEPDIKTSLGYAQELSTAVSQLAKLDLAVSYESSTLSYLVNTLLFSVIIESSKMTDNASKLIKRPTINVWEKMLVPVQGGKFKVSADGAAQKTTEYLDSLTGRGAAELREAGKAFRAANFAFQSRGSKLLSSTIQADTGADIIAAPVIEAHPALMDTTFKLWQASLDYLDDDLQRQRSATMLDVVLAGLVGGLVITAAFAIAVALSRALADRTMQEFEKLGFHDPLTGLPNRRALLNKIRSLPQSETGARSGLIVIDLRQFKKINDRFGDQSGDTTLRDVSEMLSHQVEPEDFLCRTGGTEFTVLRPQVMASARFELFAQKLLQEIGKDRFFHNNKITINANAGVFISQSSDPITENGLTDAALALRSAKQKGPLKTDQFTPDMRTAFEENDEIAKQLQTALKNGEMVAWYQPQVNIHTGKVVGAEALARWVVDGTVRYPGTFLPAAVEAGYMEQIEATVRERALRLAVNLIGKTHHPIHLGLNVSASLLTNPKAVDALDLQVNMMGLEPSDISLEILEAVMIDEITATPIKENIARLSELGFFIELDDFGTGHSSISSLRDLKVDRVKIDRSFISGVDTNPGLQKFTSALISLAKSLDISVLAEGVETEGERDWLKENGCDVIQGFLISKAVPEHELTALILKQNFVQSSSQSSPKLVAQARS